MLLEIFYLAIAETIAFISAGYAFDPFERLKRPIAKFPVPPLSHIIGTMPYRKADFVMQFK